MMGSIIFCLFLLFVCTVYSQPFYIATNGSDSNTGTIDSPFFSFTRAQEAILSLPPQKQDIIVCIHYSYFLINIRGGDYIVNASINFNAKHSGTPLSFVKYIGYPEETVRILGGPEVTGWTQVDEDVANEFGLAPEVLQVNLQDQGITDYGELTTSHADRLELFFQNSPMNLARYPNIGDWLFTASLPNGANGSEFTYNGTRPSRWTNATDIWLHGYWTWDWADSYVHVLSVDVNNNSSSSPFSLFLLDPKTPPVYGLTVDRRFYALNLLVELDEPGEYYLERTTGILYFYPPAPITSGQTFVSMQKNIFTFTDTSYFTLQDLQIMFARTTAVTVSYGINFTVDNCIISNNGQTSLSFESTESSTVSNCEMFGNGDGCMSVYSGDRTTLTSANNLIFNNTLHDYARLDRTYQPGIGWGGVGNVISSNTIYNAPHNAILGGGNNYIFEYNTVFNVCAEVSDSGAFYTGRSWSQEGNIVRYNTFKDIRKTTVTTSGGTVQAIYLDDQMSGYIIYGNLIQNCELGFMLGGGRHNIVYNNTFRYNDNDIEFDDRGLTWQKPYCNPGGVFQQDLETFNYQQPPWSTEYPWLVNAFEQSPCTPVGNVIQYNSFCNATTFINASPQTIASWNSTFSDNIQVQC